MGHVFELKMGRWYYSNIIPIHEAPKAVQSLFAVNVKQITEKQQKANPVTKIIIYHE